MSDMNAYWYTAGKQHREAGPAYIHYRQGGPRAFMETWMWKGEEHRKAGSYSEIFYLIDGSVDPHTWKRINTR